MMHSPHLLSGAPTAARCCWPAKLRQSAARHVVGVWLKHHPQFVNES